ncbi:24430_t:CDS:2 [Dentiscutata erythropus]|uniref:24430_t:CDS:1 n=1 Tax=Dentiscutata erythropus TaxID=1348616 RepID=A0A9N9I8D9_9GLOM|nr:24430_t:CDS:2 [Dentiscutata erythropus]
MSDIMELDSQKDEKAKADQHIAFIHYQKSANKDHDNGINTDKEEKSFEGPVKSTELNYVD